MNNVMGIINLAETGEGLNSITSHRPIATIPFGGRYRLIDFTLSGMVNSGITNVGILAPRQQRSLLDHLKSGKDWQLARKKDGLVVLPPDYENDGHSVHADVRSLFNHIDFLRRSQQQYVVFAPADIVGNFTFREPFYFHQKSGADVTLLYKREQLGHPECQSSSRLVIDQEGRVTGVQTSTPTENAHYYFGAAILAKKLLIELVSDCCRDSSPDTIFQAITSKLDCLRVNGCEFPGYLARIHCMHSYYRHNMELLNPETWATVFAQTGPIYTKIRDEAPAKYGPRAVVTQAIVAGGCRIDGLVDSSVLFRRVVVGKAARVKDSILMTGTEVGEGAMLANVVCDKNVRITAGKQLKGDSDNPLVLRKGTVV